jgi:hypothetical protein
LYKSSYHTLSICFISAVCLNNLIAYVYHQWKMKAALILKNRLLIQLYRFQRHRTVIQIIPTIWYSHIKGICLHFAEKFCHAIFL